MRIQRRQFVATVGGVVALGLSGCTSGGGSGDDDLPGIVEETLTLATTTSTHDTGLLSALNAPFEARYGVTVNVVPLGTGAALETGRRGDCDAVLVHARSLEDEFVRAGYGINRRDLIANDFVVVGVADDPAGISDVENVTDAFRQLAASETTFVSRGDNSGTHAKELELWDAADVGDGKRGEWYREAGQGMGEVLVQTDRVRGYTLADRGTFQSMRDELALEIHVQGPLEGGPDSLSNPYGIVAVNPARHEHVAYDLAMAYIGFLTGVEGQRIVEEYAVEGKRLFVPIGLDEDPNLGQYFPESWNGGGR